MNRGPGIILLCGCVFLLAAATHEDKPYPFRHSPFMPEMPEPNNNKVTVAGARLGRYLFYDSSLSAGNHISCGSCHQQSAAFSNAPLRFSKGSHGSVMQRNTQPLFNLAWYPALFWDGRAATIEAQVTHPINATDEMNMQWPVAIGRINNNPFYREAFRNAFGKAEADSTLIVKAIGQFLRTLISDRSRYDKALAGEVYLTPDEREGLILMNDQTKGNCLHCHTTDEDALGTTGDFANIGLETVPELSGYKDKGRGAVSGRPDDIGKFRIPSLRNIALTAPYMHDGRFTTLEEVLDYYSEQLKWTPNIDSRLASIHSGGLKLLPEEKKKIIAFLHTLTDSAFISDPEFTDPFIKKPTKASISSGR